MAYKKCTTEKTVRQQRQFESALLEEMGKHPYSVISIQSLCDRTGLSRNIFYRLFECKDDVLIALVDHALTEFANFMYDSDSPMKDAERFYAYWLEKKPLLDVLERNQKSNLLLERIILHVANEEYSVLVRLGAVDPVFRDEVILFYITGMMTMVINWHHSGYKKTVHQMAQITHRLMENLN